MPTPEEGALLLFKRGDYVQLIREFSEVSKASPASNPSLTLTVAHALAITGDLRTSKRLASTFTGQRLSEFLQARAHWVLGLAAERSGHVDDALAEYKKGLGTIGEGDNETLAAWLHLHQFRLMLEGQSKELLTAAIPLLRRRVLRVGDAQLTAYLHMCIAVLEGETGHFDEAYRHIEVANSLLEITDSASLRSANLLNKGCLAILAGELSEAADCFNLAKTFTARTGDPFISSRADGNLAHIHLFTGEFERAKETLERTLRDGTLGKLGEVGALDGLARVHLARGDLDACEQCLDGIEAHRTKHEALPSMYHVRWAGLTRARLLVHRSQFKRGATLLAQLRRDTQAVRDEAFEGGIALTSALVWSHLGTSGEPGRWHILADRSGAVRVPELQPQLYHVGGIISRTTDLALSRSLAQRANRLWDAQGVVSMRVELDDSGIDIETARKELKAARTTPPTPPRTIETITNAIAATFDLAHRPRLFAVELLSIVRALDCSPGATLLETRGAVPESSEEQTVMTLGSEGDRTFALACPIPADAAKAILLGDVLRLAASGLALESARREERNRSALWPASPAEEQAGALFIAEEMQNLLATIRRIASANIPVLITGETGTGKEVLARTIHAYSDRAARPFSPFNCSATPRDMLDAQLFGHRKGAFTGATEHFPGVIRAASGGTLFLDEIGEITLDLQPKLLRFLEAGEVHPIGDTQPTRVNVRVIAATNADLDALVAQGRFREDLYYRLNIVHLHVPPLRNRREEIPVLAQHYLDKCSLEVGKHGLRLAEETVEYLVLYKWPGNVRQLANEMRRMTALADNGAVLMPEHLSGPITASRRTLPVSERKLEPTEMVVRLDQPLPAATAHVERTMILHAMKKCHNRMEDTAAMLGLSRKGLYLKRQRLGLDPGAGGVEA